jgi:hypothetical protein
MSENKCFACHGKGCYMCAEKQPLTWEDVDLLAWLVTQQPRGVQEHLSSITLRMMAHLPPRNK